MKKTHRILIVDDHPLMRKGLAMTLNTEPDIEVCCQADSAEDAMTLLEASAPDLAIVDISLPGMSGIEFIKHMHLLFPKVIPLVVSRHEETLYAERAIRAGARGYVMKLEAADVIVQAVRRVMNGGIYVSADINERLLVGMASGQHHLTETPLDVLSDRDLEVFELTVSGHGTREIAE